MEYVILSLFSLVGFVMGIYLYGESKIKQIQSCGFFGLAIGCILIMIFGM